MYIVHVCNNANRLKKKIFCNFFTRLFLTYRGEKYLRYYTILYYVWQVMWGFHMQKPLLAMVAFGARVYTSVNSSPMLWFNCPISRKPLAPPILDPPSIPHTHMWHKIKTEWAEDNIGTLKHTWSDTVQPLVGQDQEILRDLRKKGNRSWTPFSKSPYNFLQLCSAEIHA